ncbi:MAG: ferrous iron transport protein A [Gemmatimonadetes bacterium]|nr:ferrous iron transport protein A [Gemmatimonadota bacterium]
MTTEFPLTFMQAGERKQVVGVRCDAPARERLIEMGFRKGVEVHIVEADETAYTVGLEDQQIRLVPWIASYIYVGEE